MLLDFPLLHVRGDVQSPREFGGQRGGRNWRDMDGVVGIPGDAVFARGFDRLPVVAVLIDAAGPIPRFSDSPIPRSDHPVARSPDHPLI